MAAEYTVDIHFTHDKNYDLMNIGSFAIATSGTVVLEAAIMGLPCVALYRMAPLSYTIGKMLVKIDNFTLPNILAGRAVQQELLQDQVTGPKVYEARFSITISLDIRTSSIISLIIQGRYRLAPAAIMMHTTAKARRLV